MTTPTTPIRRLFPAQADDPVTELAEENLTLKARLGELEAELERARQRSTRLSRMLEATLDGVLLADLDGNIEYANRSVLALMGIENEEELFCRSIFDFSGGTHGEVGAAEVKSILESGSTWSGEISIRRPDATEFPAEVSYTLVSDDNEIPRYILATFRDLSRQRQLEEDLRQSQKMEAIGTLAGGVAHDMNNVLGAITNLASVMKIDTAPGDRHRQDIEDILTAARRGRELARNLLGFARKGKYHKERLSVNELVEEVEELLVHTVPKTIEMQLLLDDSVPEIEGDHGQISHALMNVCLNAVDAMSKQGVITCTTKAVGLDGLDLASWPELDPGEYVRIEVIDTGTGMTREVLEHAFEPFYTTKGPEHGTGLGLAMVYGTVTNHGGGVNISSNPNTGTKVTLMLPLAKSKATPVRDSGRFKTVRAPIPGSLLLVDDEDLIRRSASRLLTRLGYNVILARNGIEALEILSKRKNEISVVILDLIMPKMDGEQTFYKIKEISPKVPVLISSGYSKDEKVSDLLEAGADGFIPKPFDINTISQEITAAYHRY